MTSTGHSYCRDQNDPGERFVDVFAPFYYRSQAVIAAFDGAFGFGARLWRAVVIKSRERTTINSLSELDDRSLTDIGVPRSAIRHIARRLAQDPQYNHRAAMD